MECESKAFAEQLMPQQVDKQSKLEVAKFQKATGVRFFLAFPYRIKIGRLHLTQKAVL